MAQDKGKDDDVERTRRADDIIRPHEGRPRLHLSGVGVRGPAGSGICRDLQPDLRRLGLGEGRHVSAKVREFVAIALLAFRGAERAGLVAHMERAMRLGATCEEIFEVLETCLVPGGAPTFHRGLGALLELKDGGGP